MPRSVYSESPRRPSESPVCREGDRRGWQRPPSPGSPEEPIDDFDGPKAFHTWPQPLSLKKPELAYSDRLALPRMAWRRPARGLDLEGVLVGWKPSKTS